MTQDQLDDANKTRLMALASAELSTKFRESKVYGPSFSKDSKSNTNCLNLSRNGYGTDLTIDGRPEVFVAWQACMALMQQALDAEAKRWATAFDEFEITK